MLIQMGSRILQRMSPAGLVLAGVALAFSLPPVRKGIRSAAVMATRGVFMATGTIRNTASMVREELGGIVAEARYTDNPMMMYSESDEDHRNPPLNHDGLEGDFNLKPI